ncbi:MAG TPA: hypothetical protein IAC49_02020, partial [Candidatus Ventricola intestinavium]|nr:hypothetical protein [Candidatus Ventricola intestinavium]
HRAKPVLSRHAYGFWERVRRARALMNMPHIHALFSEVRLCRFPPRLAVRLGLMKHRQALLMCFLFSYVFDRV